MERYDINLIGNKEMYIPYNAYKFQYEPGSVENVMKPKFVNPDIERWELHRVWVVDATLKEGKRHIYAKRTFYIDEDTWIALATDAYDARGALYVSQFMPSSFSYDVLAPTTSLQVYYNFMEAYGAGHVRYVPGITYNDGLAAAHGTGSAGRDRHPLIEVRIVAAGLWPTRPRR
jgi:hypothetical protein